MPDWTRSMEQTFEFYEVDPSTWADAREITNVTGCVIAYDATVDTLASASIDCDEDLTDKYVRPYLVTVQDRIRERFPLGTYLCQTPSRTFDGKRSFMTQDCYSPLIELKEKTMPLGYSLNKNVKILNSAALLTEENVRAPVVAANSDKKLDAVFVSDTSDTMFTFIRDLLANAEYHFDLDDTGRILFAPNQDISAMQPIWTYSDDNSSILFPSVEVRRDLFNVPNVVEVIYSPSGKSYPLYSKVVNNDKDSIVSTVNRGREIVYRDTNPNVASSLTSSQLKEYATNLLKRLSSIEYTVTYSHGYCPVRVGDCVLLNYARAGINNTRAVVRRQSLSCTTGAKVEETAVYTEQLWG